MLININRGKLIYYNFYIVVIVIRKIYLIENDVLTIFKKKILFSWITSLLSSNQNIDSLHGFELYPPKIDRFSTLGTKGLFSTQ